MLLYASVGRHTVRVHNREHIKVVFVKESLDLCVRIIIGQEVVRHVFGNLSVAWSAILDKTTTAI